LQNSKMPRYVGFFKVHLRVTPRGEEKKTNCGVLNTQKELKAKARDGRPLALRKKKKKKTSKKEGSIVWAKQISEVEPASSPGQREMEKERTKSLCEKKTILVLK